MRGLWQRNGNFFANQTVADDLRRKTSRWVPLTGASFTDAKADYDRLRVKLADDRLRPLGLTPICMRRTVNLTSNQHNRPTSQICRVNSLVGESHPLCHPN